MLHIDPKVTQALKAAEEVSKDALSSVPQPSNSAPPYIAIECNYGERQARVKPSPETSESASLTIPPHAPSSASQEDVVVPEQSALLLVHDDIGQTSSPLESTPENGLPLGISVAPPRALHGVVESAVDQSSANGIHKETPTPPTMKVAPTYLDKIPESMRKRGNWVNYMLLPTTDGKLTKVPYRAGSDKKAACNNPTTWANFNDAVASMSDYRGLGFVLPPSRKLWFLDLDHVRDQVTGVIDAWAQRLIDMLDTYSEISPSGTGIHVIGFVEGTIPPKGLHRGQAELYTNNRYMTVTGNRLSSCPMNFRVVM